MYSIKSCPIPFHDLLEIFEFLVNLPSIYLWQYQGLDILIMSYPLSRFARDFRISCQSSFNLLVAISRFGYPLEWSSYHEDIASVCKWYYVCLVHYRSPFLRFNQNQTFESNNVFLIGRRPQMFDLLFW
nr:MAG TPA: hypothetical protein [Bacteriophage sp.]